MISRRKLYELGEPLGSDATRKVAGRIIYGGGGDSSSSSRSSTTTNNTDSRMAFQNSAYVGTGASVNGLTINDPEAQIFAMDTVGKSTQAALTSNENVSRSAIDSMLQSTATAVASANASAQAAMANMNAAAANAMAAATAASAGASASSAASSANSANVANNAMAGTWAAASAVGDALIDGMNTVLTSSQTVMDMENQAFKQVGGQISSAYQAASDISTGNRQLVTVGMIAVGIIAMMVLNKGHIA